jgi:hypothetical protein
VKIGNTLALACLLSGATVAYAHHSFAMFDMTKTVTLIGVVTEYDWENPHTHFLVKVPDSAGKELAGTWPVEGGAVNIMVRQGWSGKTFKAGDPIHVVAHPMKDGSKAASLYYVILPDGKKLFHDVARPNADGSVSSPQP